MTRSTLRPTIEDAPAVLRARDHDGLRRWFLSVATSTVRRHIVVFMVPLPIDDWLALNHAAQVPSPQTLWQRA